MKFVYEEKPVEAMAANQGPAKKKKPQKKVQPTLLYVEIVEVEGMLQFLVCCNNLFLKDWTSGKPSDDELKKKDLLDNRKYFSEEYEKSRTLV